MSIDDIPGLSLFSKKVDADELNKQLIKAGYSHPKGNQHMLYRQVAQDGEDVVQVVTFNNRGYGRVYVPGTNDVAGIRLTCYYRERIERSEKLTEEGKKKQSEISHNRFPERF